MVRHAGVWWVSGLCGAACWSVVGSWIVWCGMLECGVRGDMLGGVRGLCGATCWSVVG